jgi:hypothetical protein
MRRIFITAAVAATLAPLAHAVTANDWDLRSRTIPASACTPRDSVQAAQLEMVAGAWRFVAGATGKVTLTCPLPISFFPADHAQYGSPTSMYFYRVWYRDADGASGAGGIVVIPYLRSAPGGGWSNIGLVGGGGGFVPPGVCQFSSNAHPAMTFMAQVQECRHEVQMNALYSFEVTLSRTTAGTTVEFHGIDFFDGVPPAG